jgi:beta-galactosidase
MTQQSHITAAFGPVPDGVEVSRRVGGGKRVFILINYAHEQREVKLPHPMKAWLANRQADKIELPPYGVEVLSDSQ